MEADANLIQERMQKQVFPLVCAHAQIEALTADERRTVIASLDRDAVLRELASIQSRLDIATATDWSHAKVETDLLNIASAPWAPALSSKIAAGTHRLIPPRSMTQLMRETLEAADPRPGSVAVSHQSLIELVLSINAEHLAEHDDLGVTGDLNSDDIERLVAGAAELTPEQQLATLRQLTVDEVANLQSNAPAKLELLQAATKDLWFTTWPDRVTDPRLGEVPADCFHTATGVELIDVLVLGQIIAEEATTGRSEFARTDLVAEGATPQAVEFLFDNMALSAPAFRDHLARDRSSGAIADQRYTMTQHPFVLLEDDTVLLLRHQWALERFFGTQLYWQTFFSLGKPKSGSTAEAFSQGMNYVFERIVGDRLAELVNLSPKMTRLVHETEMQAAWTQKAGQPPSVCDFVIIAGRACLVRDATNHHLNVKLAQGLGSVDDYSEDVDTTFVERKFGQLVSTATQLRDRLDFGLLAEPRFFPFIVVPDNGLPNVGSTQLDLQIRATEPFAPLHGTSRPPAILNLSDLGLLVGLAEHYGRDRDILDLIGGWRQVATEVEPMGLPEYVEKAGLPRPIPRRMLDASRDLQQTIQQLRTDAKARE